MTNIYIIGHKNPDTDSICSVIAYADLLARINPKERYIPARCGKINPETNFVLQKFSVPPPQHIESLRPDISDLPFTYTISAPMDMPTIDIVEMMDKNGIRNIPITDENGHLAGLISEHGLSHAYVRRKKIEQLSLSPIRLETLARILNARMILGREDDLLEGRVYIAIDALHVALSRLTANDVAVVGDNEPAQLALISAGIAALIIADGAPAGERVINEAEEQKIALLSTSLDAFGVGKMINLSLPAKQVMATDVPVVTQETTIDVAKRLVSDSRYRTACVVGEDNRLLGMISRNTFLNDVAKKVILLDHNEFAQAVEGIESAEILEIIDHHRIGTISTLKPIRFLNDPVGSTSTIIALKFRDLRIEPEMNIAGILLSGILSDTLGLRLSTTTPVDTEMAQWLGDIAGFDYTAFGNEIIRHGMTTEGTPIRELIMRDIKQYELFGRKVTVAQVMIPSFSFCTEHEEEIEETLSGVPVGSKELFIVLFTSIGDFASKIYWAGEIGTLIGKGKGNEQIVLEGVMSRKNDFIPWIGQKLKLSDF